MLQESKNPQLVYQRADLILRIQVVDSNRRKLFKADVNILDKKKVTEMFNLLRLKFSLTIPKDLKEDLDSQGAWDKLKLG